MVRKASHGDNPPPFEPLPDNAFCRQMHPTWHDAYARCTRLFFWAVGRQPPPGAAPYDMCSRVLGHLVLEAPTERGCDWVCKKILNCADEHALARLAQKYIFIFVGAFKASAGHSSSSGSDSSGCSPGGGDGPRLHAHDSDCDEKRILVLERDACKCAITGAWSSISAATSPTAHDASLEVTLIVPPSVDIHTLAQYAGLSSNDPLRGPSPHFYRVENMLTLDDETSVEFRNLNVWLEGTERDDQYQITTWRPDTLPASRRYTITFTTTDYRTRPIPSIHYLRLHAACARVAHKSGAAIYIDELVQNIAKLTVLEEDGSSAGVLAAALARVAAM